MNFVTKINIGLERLLAARASAGPYRFLVKKWHKFSSLDLAAKVIDTEYFKEQVIPLPLPLADFTKVLVLAPHQDDETIGAGGTLSMLRDLNAEIDIVYLTDGGITNWSDSMEKLILVRFEEAKEVCKRLNARMHRLDISNYRPQPTLNDLEKLAGIIKDQKPQIVLIPWLLDSPPKHKWANHLLYLCEKKFSLPAFEVCGYQVHNTLLPNTYVDITDVSDQKLDLLKIFGSQNEYYQRYDHITMGMNAWNSRYIAEPQNKPKARFIELFFTLPKKEYLQLIEKFYMVNFNSTYSNDQKVIEGIRQLHGEVFK